MVFGLFALGTSLTFLAASLFLLNHGRNLGLAYLHKAGADSVSGLNSVEGAVFALIGLLLAFTVSGALQRFDERRQLVIQEANAVSTAYDRIDLLDDADAVQRLKARLKEYVQARIDLYRLPHDLL